jgi:hypothetical protein
MLIYSTHMRTHHIFLFKKKLKRGGGEREEKGESGEGRQGVKRKRK